MRYRRVHAYAFGAFLDQTLELAPGLNIVYGPNEAGKSTWHAATYLALCGLRRSRGKPSPLEKELSRYQPWRSDRWEVGAIIELADGREIELRYDLASRTVTTVEETATGRSVLTEITHGGGPDGARWLGLDRVAFLKTACVRQADLFDVRKDPSTLQEYLQRAATSSNADSTVAQALERIKLFHQDHVGVNRANAVKPLRKAIEWEQAAKARLEDAKAALSDYLALEAQLDELECQVEEAELALRTARAAQAIREAEEEITRFWRAEELASRFPDGRPPALGADDELAAVVAAALDAWERRPNPPVLSGRTAEELRAELESLPDAPPASREVFDEVVAAIDAWGNRPQPPALEGPDLATLRAALDALPAPGTLDRSLDDAVAAALDAWEHRPDLPELTGPDAAAIRAELDALPPIPEGDLAVAKDVEVAYTAADNARRAVELHDRSRPEPVPLPETGGATPDELRDLARELTQPIPEVDPALLAEYERAQEASSRPATGNLPLALVSALLVLAGLGVLLAGQTMIGVVLAGLGLAGLVGMLILRGQSAPGRDARLAELAARIEAQRQNAAAVEQRVAAARARASSLGLPDQPAALRQLATERAAAEAANRDLERWAERQMELSAALAEALEQLRLALQQRGIAVDEDPFESYQRYAADCSRRKEQALAAARRPELERQLAARLAADDAAEKIARQRQDAEQRLQEVARRCQIDATDPDAMVAGLRVWQTGREAQALELTKQRDELSRKIAAREAAERQAVEIAETRASTERRLWSVAERCGVTAATSEQLVEVLRDWQQRWEAHSKAFARRPELERLLAHRVEAEERAERDARQLAETVERVRAVAARCGLSGASDDDLVAGLREWQVQRAELRSQQEQALRDWGELESLLGGRTLAELKAEVSEHFEAAQALAEGLDPAAIEAASADPDLEQLIEARQATLDRARSARANAAGQVAERARSLPSVAAAEEELAAAQAERARVERLDRVLTKTQELLRQAEAQVHRDIAPVLASSVQQRLARVTGGRYQQVRVDPQSLTVRVAGEGGHWRDADKLSHGTAEQVYLLLRVALAERLAPANEPCPLILDDVTVQSDEERTRAILETLQTLSEERQVILFSQEEDVRRWAEQHLDAERDRLILLDRGLVAA